MTTLPDGSTKRRPQASAQSTSRKSADVTASTTTGAALPSALEDVSQALDVDAVGTEKRRHAVVVVGFPQPGHHLAERRRGVRGAFGRRHEKPSAHAFWQHRTRKAGERGGAIHFDVGDVVLRASFEARSRATAPIDALGRSAREHAHSERLGRHGGDLAPRAWRRRAEAIDEALVGGVRPVLVAMDVERQAVKVGRRRVRR